MICVYVLGAVLLGLAGCVLWAQIQLIKSREVPGHE
jgi:hypothetical protein